MKESRKWTLVGTYGHYTPDEDAEDSDIIEGDGVRVAQALCPFKRWGEGHAIEDL
jgi:hypothetical protein